MVRVPLFLFSAFAMAADDSSSKLPTGDEVVANVHSSAVGDLNDFNQFFGNVPNAIIRPNERTLLGFDAPNRFLLWGQFAAPWKTTISPVFEVHTGFPYSIVNEERDYIGPRNRDGRFPRFSSLDIQVTKAFAIPIGEKRLHAQVGCAVFDILNHYNPATFKTIPAAHGMEFF